MTILYQKFSLYLVKLVVLFDCFLLVAWFEFIESGKRGVISQSHSMGILPYYNNILVHDHFYPYNKYSCIHSYCNAHILRELNGIIVKDNTLWSKDMFNLLTNMNIAVHKAS